MSKQTGFSFASSKKSLIETIDEIKKSKMSRNEKIVALKACGLREKEISDMLKVYVPSGSTSTRFVYTFGVEIECVHAERNALIEAGRQNGVDIQVTKVEFNSIETRFYVTVTNNSSEAFNVWTSDAKVVQGGQQYEETYNMDADYPVLSTSLLPGATSSGAIVFPVVSQSEMQLHIEGASDDWETDFQPFEFTLSN